MKALARHGEGCKHKWAVTLASLLAFLTWVDAHFLLRRKKIVPTRIRSQQDLWNIPNNWVRISGKTHCFLMFLNVSFSLNITSRVLIFSKTILSLLLWSLFVHPLPVNALNEPSFRIKPHNTFFLSCNILGLILSIILSINLVSLTLHHRGLFF